MPSLYPNLATVNETVDGSGNKLYTIMFSEQLAIVSDLVEAAGAVNTTITRVSEATRTGESSQLVIEDLPTNVFSLNSTVSQVYIFFT